MGQLRKQARSLSARVREGDVLAANALLKHSISLGHRKLAARRFFLARAMGATMTGQAQRYCMDILVGFSAETIRTIAEEEHLKALCYKKRRNTNG